MFGSFKLELVHLVEEQIQFTFPFLSLSILNLNIHVNGIYAVGYYMH